MYVNGHKAAQAREYMNEDGSGVLISYSTTVIEIDSDGWMYVNGLYSMTTRKHIGWFMHERGLDYYLAKELYEKHERYNIRTGEIEKLA